MYKHAGEIVDVNIRDETLVKITCENLIIKVSALADCCSESWFEFPYGNINKIIGNKIKGITEENEINLPFSNRQEVDINNIIRIKFNKDNSYDFVLRNSSNGYYSGWIEVDFIEKEKNTESEEKNTESEEEYSD